MPVTRRFARFFCGVVTLASCGSPVYHQPPRDPVWTLAAPPPPPIEAPSGPGSFVNVLGIRMVRVPGGTIACGSAADEAGRSADETIRTVSLPDFYVSQTEVTQAQFEALMGFNPSQFRDPARPVETVQATEATAFCVMLSTLDGRRYSLPDEDAWEFACRRGGAPGVPPTPVTETSTRPVEETPRDSIGLHGMIGNVAELCSHGYVPNRRMPPSERDRYVRRHAELVVRGGSWDSPRCELRPGFRGHCDARVADDTIGFRVFSFPQASP